MTAQDQKLKHIQQKVVYLERLAADQGTPAHEAAVAAARAAYLKDKYRLSSADLELAGLVPKEDPVADRENPIYAWGGRVQVWKRSLALVLCKHFGVSTWESFMRRREGKRVSRQVKLCLCGRPSDVKLVREFYDHLVTEALRLSIPECRGLGRSYSLSWLRGFVTGVHDQLAEVREKSKAEAEASGKGCAAMVLWSRGDESEAALEQQVPNLKDCRARRSRVSSAAAFYRGREIGKSVQPSGKSLGPGHSLGPAAEHEAP